MLCYSLESLIAYLVVKLKVDDVKVIGLKCKPNKSYLKHLKTIRRIENNFQFFFFYIFGEISWEKSEGFC